MSRRVVIGVTAAAVLLAGAGLAIVQVSGDQGDPPVVVAVDATTGEEAWESELPVDYLESLVPDSARLRVDGVTNACRPAPRSFHLDVADGSAEEVTPRGSAGTLAPAREQQPRLRTSGRHLRLVTQRFRTEVPIRADADLRTTAWGVVPLESDRIVLVSEVTGTAVAGSAGRSPVVLNVRDDQGGYVHRHMTAFDASTGRVRWSSSDVASSVAVSAGRLLELSPAGTVRVRDVLDGELLDERPVPAVPETPAFDQPEATWVTPVGAHVLLMQGYGRQLSALGEDGRPIWTRTGRHPTVHLAASADGEVLYLGNSGDDEDPDECDL